MRLFRVGAIHELPLLETITERVFGKSILVPVSLEDPPQPPLKSCQRRIFETSHLAPVPKY
jgi:hypothetical protein